jgi:hypothetical protein
MRNEWEVDFQPDVALPLIVQPIKDLISEVVVRLINEFRFTHKPQNVRSTFERFPIDE